MRYLFFLILLLTACTRPNYYHAFAYKTQSYWEGEYEGHKISFKILSSAKKKESPAFYASCTIGFDSTTTDTLQLAFKTNFHHLIPTNKQTFIGQTLEPSLFYNFEGNDSTLAVALTLEFEIKEFDPLVLIISSSFARHDALSLHPAAERITHIFPVFRPDKHFAKHTVTMKEKYIGAK